MATPKQDSREQARIIERLDALCDEFEAMIAEHREAGKFPPQPRPALKVIEGGKGETGDA